MAINYITVTEGVGKNMATTTITEAAVVKDLQRFIPNDANGSVYGTVSNPIYTRASISGTITASIAGGNMTVNIIGPSTTSVVGSLNINSIIGEVTLYAQPSNYRSSVSGVITNAAANSILGAPGASLRYYITAVKVTNAAAAAAIVDIKDSGALILDTGYAAASGGGWSSSFPTPLRQATTNASIDVVPRSQASILVSISGYIAP